jgi:UDP-N-acetylglucosamine acyltransferase
MALIHPTAIVDAAADLAADVRVGPYAIIGAQVTLGAGSQVGSHAVITGPTHIGKLNTIGPHAVIGCDPQDLKYKGEVTGLRIGDRNTFREFTTVSRGSVTGRHDTVIGNDNLFMAYAHVAHDCVVGSHCVLANYAGLAGHVELDDWVILGGYAGVHQFCKVGAHAFLANNATTTRDVPPFVLVAEAPAVPKGVNIEGLKRRGFTDEQIVAIKEAYRLLYRNQLKLADAIEQITALARRAPVVQAIVDFMPRVTRSLVR